MCLLHWIFFINVHPKFANVQAIISYVHYTIMLLEQKKNVISFGIYVPHLEQKKNNVIGTN